jgi:hypothetical protein
MNAESISTAVTTIFLRMACPTCQKFLFEVDDSLQGVVRIKCARCSAKSGRDVIVTFALGFAPDEDTQLHSAPTTIR